MAANTGWFGDWWLDGAFPPVWFAPSDDDAVTEPEVAATLMVSTGGAAPDEEFIDRAGQFILRDDEEIAILLALALGEIL